MRFVGTEDERVTGRNVGLAVLVANTAFSGNDQIQFPLSRVRVVREIASTNRATSARAPVLQKFL